MRSSCYLLCLLLLTASVRAEEPTRKRVDPSSAPDVQDVVYFGKTRPILIRLHVLADGKPYTEAWENHLKKRFAYADRDRNGALDREEAKVLPSAQILQQMSQSGYFNFNGAPARFENLDGDRDGKITLAELRAYYEDAFASALRLVPLSNNGGNRMTEALFREFDRNKDGKISKEEFAGADRLVARLDSDEDETVDANELVNLNVAADFRRQPVVVRGGGMMPGMRGGAGQGQSVGDFTLVPREKEPNRLTQRLAMGKQLLARYDKDKSGKLIRQEIGLDDELFKRLDRDDDGVLDLVELMRYVIISPDLEVTVQLSREGSKAGSVQVTPGSKANLARKVRRSSAAGVTLAMESSEFEVRRADAAAQPYQRLDQYYLRIFQTLDQGNTGVVEIKRLQEQRYQAMRPMFQMADVDGDGKVTRKEFTEMVSLQTEVARCTTSLGIGEMGQGLFEMLDVNRDGRLSVRELRLAWQRVAAYDHDKDEAVATTEIPQQFLLALAGGPMNQAFARTLGAPGGQPVQARKTGGPIWFSRMDRNGDGDVSEREFLGTPEDFKRIDEDGDGYISQEEAERIDARLRKSKP